MVLEVMGRSAGWIALESAISGGADVALIPEIPYDIEKAAETINKRKQAGKNFSIVVVSEGAFPKDGEILAHSAEGVDNKAGISIKYGGIGEKVAKQLQELTGLDARCTTLGYMQRGGTPTAYESTFNKIWCKSYGTCNGRKIWSSNSTKKWKIIFCTIRRCSWK